MPKKPSTEETLLVKSNFDGVHTIGLPRIGGMHDHLVLMPGPNMVNVELWAEAKKQVMVQKCLEVEKLVEMGEKALENTSERAMLKMVTETVDKKTLEAWSKKEKRRSVLKAIEAQLEKIGPTKPPPPADE